MSEIALTTILNMLNQLHISILYIESHRLAEKCETKAQHDEYASWLQNTIKNVWSQAETIRNMLDVVNEKE